MRHATGNNNTLPLGGGARRFAGVAGRAQPRASAQPRAGALRQVARGIAMAAWFSTTGAACFFFDDGGDPPPQTPVPECSVDAECIHLDDGDACYGDAYCNANDGSCERDFLQDAEACQCDTWRDCRVFGFDAQGCNEVTCNEHQCGEIIVATGPSPDDREGDCMDLRCDGINAAATSTMNAGDIDDDRNPCTIDSCSEDGPVFDGRDDGEVCDDGAGNAVGICYDATCFDGCVPNDPLACGDEGPSEPSNDQAFNATAVGEHDTTCGMLDRDDVDWFEMYAEDEDFEADILGFEVMSSASTVELCAYVVCDNGGFPDGGCGNKIDGPVGGAGCCWTGDPATLAPTWDLDCSETSDDSGTVFFSVRTPNGGACETYRVKAHY